MEAYTIPGFESESNFIKKKKILAFKVENKNAECWDQPHLSAGKLKIKCSNEKEIFKNNLPIGLTLTRKCFLLAEE